MSKKVDDVPIQNGVLSPKKIEDKGKDDKCLKKLSKLPCFDEGLARRNYTCFTLVECLDQSYTNELVTYDVIFPSNTHLNSLRLYDAVNQIFVIYQLSEITYQKIIYKDCKKKGLVRAKISFWVDQLDAKSKRLYVLFHDTGNGFAPPKFPELKVRHTNLSQELVEIGNKTIGIRLWGGVQSYSNAEASTLPGLIGGVKGADGIWRGTGAMVADLPVTGHELSIYEEGALWRTYRHLLTFEGGGTYGLHVKVFPHKDFVQLDEYGANNLTGYNGWGTYAARRNQQLLLLNDLNPDKFLTYTTFATNIISEDFEGTKIAGMSAGGHWSGGGWGGVYASGTSEDVIGIVPLKTGFWKGDGTFVTFFSDSEYPNELRLSMAVKERHCLLVVTNKTKAVLSQQEIDDTKSRSYPGPINSYECRITPDACYLWKLRLTWCDFPLNKVKDWVLTYDDTGFEHPGVLFGAPDNSVEVMTTAKNRLLSDPSYEYLRKYYMEKVKVIKYLANYPQAPADITDWDIGDTTNWVKEQLTVGYASNCYILSTGQALDISILYADVMWNALPANERKRWSRYALALAYILRDPDNWGHVTYTTGQLPPFGNFTGCRWVGLAMASIFFEGHPAAEKWRKFAITEVKRETSATISADGVYPECVSNYYPFWWQNVTRASLAFQRHGYADYRNNQKYHKAITFLIDILTPPDATCHQDPETLTGIRMIPPVGHHPGAGYRQFGGFAWSAKLLEGSMDVGAWSQWAWNENGHHAGHYFLLPINMFIADREAPGQPRQLVSKAWDDYGFVFRNHVGTGKESYFLLKNSRAEWHYEADEGSFHMFGKGVLLAADGLNLLSEDVPPYSPCSYCDAEKTDTTDRLSQRSAFHHNLITFRGPTNDGHIRGQWQAFKSYDTVDYGHANIPKISTGAHGGSSENSYDRRCLLIKSVDPDGPEYFVIQDTTNGSDMPEWHLDVHSPEPDIHPDGKSGWVTFPGFSDPGFGVAMDTVFVTPSELDIYSETGYMMDYYKNAFWQLKGHWLIHATPVDWPESEIRYVSSAQTDGIRGVAFSSDMNHVALGGSEVNMNVNFWNWQTNELDWSSAPGSEHMFSVAVSAQNQFVACGNRYEVQILDGADGTLIRTLPTALPWINGVPLRSLAFSPDASKLGVVCNDKNVRVYSTNSGALILTIDCGNETAYSVVFSTNGNRLAIGKEDEVSIWNLTTNQEELICSTGQGWIDSAYSISFSSDDTKLVVGSCPDGPNASGITVWDATLPIGPLPENRNSCLWRNTGNFGFVAAVPFSPNGKYVLGGCFNNYAYLWDANTGELIRKLPGTTSYIKDVAWSADSKAFLLGTSISDNKDLRVDKHFAPMTCSFFTIHYPRYQNSPSPEITAIADGKGAKVNHPWGTDTILMANETFTYNGGGINFTGKVAALRNMNGESWLTLVEGTQLGYNGQNLDGPGIIHLP